MISKLAFTAAALYEAQAALITAEGSFTSDMSCYECLTKANSKYCTDDTPYTGYYEDYKFTGGTCISLSSTCSAKNSIKVGSNGMVEAAQLACPYLVYSCLGGGLSLNDLGGWGTFGPKKAIPAKSGCSWSIETFRGMPAVKSYGQLGTDAKIALFHFTLDSRLAKSDTEITFREETYFPSTTALIHDLDSNCSGNKCSLVQADTQKEVFRMTNTNEVVSTTDILAAYTAYNSKIKKYQRSVIEYVEENPQNVDYKFPGFFGIIDFAFFFGWLKMFEGWCKDDCHWPSTMHSSQVGNYDGMEWSKLNSLGGWGDLSVQSMDPTSTNYYEYGTFGSISVEPTNSTSNALDINQVEWTKRFAVVSVYNSGSTSLAPENVKFWMKSMPVSKYNDQYTTPSVPIYYGEIYNGVTESATFLGASVMGSALLASLYL